MLSFTTLQEYHSPAEDLVIKVTILQIVDYPTDQYDYQVLRLWDLGARVGGEVAGLALAAASSRQTTSVLVSPHSRSTSCPAGAQPP